jgi:hypothetical protein
MTFLGRQDGTVCRGGHQSRVKALQGGVVPEVIQNDALVSCFLAVRHY